MCKRNYETFLKSFDKEISAICAGCSRRLKIAETLSPLESVAAMVLDAKDLIYASNICTSLTTNGSSVFCMPLACINAKTSVTEGE